MQTQVIITAKETIAPAWWRLDVAAPDLAPRLQPGQFLLLRCADSFSCYLRRPIFPALIGPNQFSLLVRPAADPGLAWLAGRLAGDLLDVIGPLGRGYPLPAGTGNLLLISDSQAIGPLLGQMERALAAGAAVTLALGGSRAEALYPLAALPPAVELQAATLDGSLGRRGPVAGLLPELLGWADFVCAAGSTGLYRALQRQTQAARLRLAAGFLYGLFLPTPLACGVGACLACSLPTAAGPKLACLEGPVFDLSELELSGDD